MSDWPQKFLHAFKQRHHYDSVSAEQQGLSMDDAYDIQHAYVTLRKEPIVGYKAAFTGIKAQQAMGINRPAIGALFASGNRAAGSELDEHKPLLLETELVFRTNRAIQGPIEADQALEYVDACLPAIELASPNLATAANAVDLVATNTASHAYIIGAPVAINQHDFDTLPVALEFDGDALWQGKGADVLGGQQLALAFLINEVLTRGYQIEPGHLLMTGSIGGMAPAKPGSYRGNFGPLGQIDFSIVG